MRYVNTELNADLIKTIALLLGLTHTMQIQQNTTNTRV